MRLLNVTRSLLCISQALLLSGLPAMAATSASTAAKTVAASDLSRVAKYEQIVFGKTQANKTVTARLGALETNLYGKPKAGTVKSRLDSIATLIGQQPSALLSPPIAPQLDVSSPVHSIASDPPASQPSYSSAPEEDQPDSRASQLLKQALTKYGAGDIGGAEALFNQVLSVDSGNGDAHFNLGAIAEGRGDIKGALNHYKQAQNANPQDTEVAQAVAQMEQKVGAQNRAQEQAKQEQVRLARETQQKEQLRKLADNAAVAYKNQNYDEAVRNLEQVAAAVPNDPEVQFGLGQALRGKGDIAAARQHLSRAISMDAGNSVYRDALAQLDREGTAFPNGDVAMAPQDSTPPGQLQPFDGVEPPAYGNSGGSPYGNSYGGGYGSGIGSALARFIPGMGGGMMAEAGMGSAYVPGIPAVSFGSGQINRSTLARAAAGGLAGAAIGAFMGNRNGTGTRNGAIRGAMYGGMAGLLFGGF